MQRTWIGRDVKKKLWKRAILVRIREPEKPYTEPKAYRLIYLLDTINKGLE